MYRVRRLINYQAAQKQHLTGQGVVAAVLDSGIIRHRDFGNRLLEMEDFVNGKKNWYDDHSHGTHVAGIIGGSGLVSGGRYSGIAPGCRLLPLKVLDRQGNGKIEVMLQALEWLERYGVEMGVRLVNISVGGLPDDDSGEDSELVRRVEKLWTAGMIVVTAAGNEGPGAGSITTPGISRKVITVGASDDDRWSSRSRLIGYSGCGPTSACIVKPEIVAPGQGIVSCSNRRDGYSVKSGTSMSAAVVTGALALLLEKHPKLTNREVKLRLFDCAVDMGLPAGKQGFGRLDIGRLL